ncbi:MAG: glycosyltransferase family 1 protein [Planctomycetota bacterium]
MRLALDYRPALFGTGGIARAVRELARALARRGDLELHLFGHALRGVDAREGGGMTAVRGEDAGDARVTLHRSRLPGRSLPWLSHLGLDASRLSGSCPLFHWTDYVYPPVRRGVRVVQTVHDLAFVDDPEAHGVEGGARLLTRFETALARADLVLCPSEATARALRRLGRPLPPVRVVPFGADHVDARAADRAAGRREAARLLGTDEPYLVCLATIEPRKNHASLLAAWRSLGDERPPLLVVGAPGWDTALVQRELRRPQPRLAWTGVLPDRDLTDLVAGARALVYPSRLEGFGFPPMEALQLGVPVLAGDCEALREHLGAAALYADGRDPEVLAPALARIHADEGLGRALVAAWQARRGRYRWDLAAAAHAEAYAACLGATAREVGGGAR